MAPRTGAVSDLSGGDGGKVYRSDLDGLRAIAVLAVVAFHAFPGQITGGYVGVDVFFVISGFLITSLILRDHQNGAFSYRAFYARRVRRIFPALAIVLAVSLAAGWFLFLPREYASLGRNVGAGASFAANFALLAESGYFDIESARKPLLHLWSLGIEEQFYIVWPFLVALTLRRGWKVLPVIVIAAAASYFLNLWLVDRNPIAAFYLPVTRAWELMAGCALASGPARSAWRFADHPLVHDMGATVGYALIGGSIAVLGKDSTFSSWWALVPVLGSALLIRCDHSWFNQRILSARPLVAIGRISYPLYLWHWPLLAFIRSATDPSLLLVLATVAGSIGLAWATFALIERPIRFGRPSWMKVVGPSIAMVIVARLGVGIMNANGFPSRLTQSAESVLRLTGSIVDPASIYGAEWRLDQCFLGPTTPPEQFDPACAGNGGRPLLFLWGSSVAAALYPGLKELQSRYHFGLAQYTASGCDPVFGMHRADYPLCDTTNLFILDQITRLRPDVILLHAEWDPSNLKLLDSSVAAIRKRSPARIVLVGGEPIWGTSAGLFGVYRAYAASHPTASTLPERTRERLESANELYEDATRTKAVELGIEYVSLRNALCNDSGCLTRIGLHGGLTTFDRFHLSLSASKFVAHDLMQKLLQKDSTTVLPKDVLPGAGAEMKDR